MVSPALKRREQRQGDGGRFGQSITGIIRMAVFWYLESKFFYLNSKGRPFDHSLLRLNLFEKGDALDMWFYVYENPNFSDFSNESALVWHQTNIPYTVWGPQSTTTLSIQYHPSQGLKQNRSLYGNVFFARSGYSPDPNDPEHLPFATFRRTHRQFHFLPSCVESQLAHVEEGQFF